MAHGLQVLRPKGRRRVEKVLCQFTSSKRLFSSFMLFLDVVYRHHTRGRQSFSPGLKAEREEEQQMIFSIDDCDGNWRLRIASDFRQIRLRPAAEAARYRPAPFHES